MHESGFLYFQRFLDLFQHAKVTLISLAIVTQITIFHAASDSRFSTRTVKLTRNDNVKYVSANTTRQWKSIYQLLKRGN